MKTNTLIPSLILLFLLFLSADVNAQNKEKILKQISSDACSCMSKIKMDAKSQQQYEELSVDVQMCLQNAMLADLSKITKTLNIDLSDNDAMATFGEELAMVLIADCKAFVEFSMLTVKFDEDLDLSDDSGNSGSLSSYSGGDVKEYQTTSGTISSVSNDGLTVLTVTDGNGKKHDFTWLRSFAGSDKYVSDSGKLQGKQIEVQWQELEVYYPAKKGYFPMKEIVSIDVLD